MQHFSLYLHLKRSFHCVFSHVSPVIYFQRKTEQRLRWKGFSQLFIFSHMFLTTIPHAKHLQQYPLKTILPGVHFLMPLTFAASCKTLFTVPTLERFLSTVHCLMYCQIFTIRKRLVTDLPLERSLPSVCFLMLFTSGTVCKTSSTIHTLERFLSSVYSLMLIASTTSSKTLSTIITLERFFPSVCSLMLLTFATTCKILFTVPTLERFLTTMYYSLMFSEISAVSEGLVTGLALKRFHPTVHFLMLLTIATRCKNTFHSTHT